MNKQLHIEKAKEKSLGIFLTTIQNTQTKKQATINVTCLVKCYGYECREIWLIRHFKAVGGVFVPLNSRRSSRGYLVVVRVPLKCSIY